MISLKILSNSRVFSDRACDFDVCEACHSKLPDEHPLPSLRISGERPIQWSNIFPNILSNQPNQSAG
jgi:hypothetical protein